MKTVLLSSYITLFYCCCYSVEALSATFLSIFYLKLDDKSWRISTFMQKVTIFRE